MLKKIAFLLLLIAPMSVFAQKFAHFKSMDIIPVMPEYAKAQTDIQTMQKQYEDEIKRASDEFNKKYAEYQQEQKNLPQNIQERRQKELQELSEIAGADFFRTHRAYLVHFKYVQKYDANCVTMENGTALIAKQNYSEFVKQYLKYNQRKGKEIG
mgnify:CR=1 FL=1